MAKKVVGYIKLQVKAGQANPSPPVGPALGQRGLNIMEFCKAFNAATSKLEPGLPTPVIITAYSDRTFTFITKTAPATVLLKKAGESLEAYFDFLSRRFQVYAFVKEHRATPAGSWAELTRMFRKPEFHTDLLLTSGESDNQVAAFLERWTTRAAVSQRSAA